MGVAGTGERRRSMSTKIVCKGNLFNKEQNGLNGPEKDLKGRRKHILKI